MFTRFRSMPATAMAAVLGCALMTTATPAAAQKKEKPKKEEAAKGKGLTASKGFAPALKKMTDAAAAKDAATLQAALAEGQASADDPRRQISSRLLPASVGHHWQATADAGAGARRDA